VLENIARVYMDTARWPEAADTLRQAIELQKDLARSHPSEHLPSLIALDNALGEVYTNLGQPERAEASYLELLATARQIAAPSGAPSPQLAESLRLVAVFYRDRGSLQQAEDYAGQASQVFRQIVQGNQDYSSYLRQALVTQAEILARRSAGCERIVALAREANAEPAEDGVIQSAQALLDRCGAGR
jgi:tetratricopeptide (TPR) repeat protein